MPSDCYRVYVYQSLVLTAQAVLLLECRQTNRQTDATECSTHAGGYAGVGNKSVIFLFSTLL